MDRPDQSDAEAAMMNRIEEAVHRAVVNALKENTAQAVARKPSKPGATEGAFPPATAKSGWTKFTREASDEPHQSRFQTRCAAHTNVSTNRLTK